MTQDEIIEMAKQAVVYRDDCGFLECGFDELEAFAKLIRDDYSFTHAQLWLNRIDEAVKAEREACALICENFADVDSYPDGIIQDYHAHLIRLRGTEA